MKTWQLIFLVTAYALPSKGAVIFTDVLDPGPGTFSDLPAMIDLDGNGTLDLGFRPRTVGGGGTLVFFEMTTSLSSAVVQIEATDTEKRQLILDQQFPVDSLDNRPLYAYTDFGGEEVGIARTVLGSYSAFSGSGEGEFFEKTGYLGFRFEGDDGTHYGYVHIDGRQAYNYRILSYAYESEPNTPILTGAIPEPSTSLLLMLLPTLVWKRRGPSCCANER